MPLIGIECKTHQACLIRQGAAGSHTAVGTLQLGRRRSRRLVVFPVAMVARSHRQEGRSQPREKRCTFVLWRPETQRARLPIRSAFRTTRRPSRIRKPQGLWSRPVRYFSRSDNSMTACPQRRLSPDTNSTRRSSQSTELAPRVFQYVPGNAVGNTIRIANNVRTDLLCCECESEIVQRGLRTERHFFTTTIDRKSCFQGLRIPNSAAVIAIKGDRVVCCRT